MLSSPRARAKVRLALALTALAAGSAAAIVPATAAVASPSSDAWNETAYRGQVEVVRTTDGPADPSVLTGTVFVDRDRDSVNDRNERGLRGVVVSNGRDVVTTDSRGRYRLPVYDNMTVFITQPSGYQVPVDASNIAQFHYNHLPEGSPELRYGGIEPTGPLPDAVNFPLVQSNPAKSQEQHCVIAGDLQPYNKTEVGYAREGAINDLAQRHDYQGCGTLFIGDVVGDDLSLYPDVKELTGLTNGPARFLPGNHDLDYDAETAEHSFDTFRAQLAPAYYSYDVGDVHVLALNTVRYPCTPDVDNADGRRPQCDDPAEKPAYNGRLGDDQLAWLERDLAKVGRDKLIVVASHISLLNWADEGSPIHNVDQVREVHDLLNGRKAVAVSGHSHSIENMKTGDLAQGWRDLFGVEGLPFPHITAGAISGDWYSGELTEDGYPVAVGRDGGMPGLLTLDVKGNSFKERYTVTGKDDEVQTQLGINSPAYREWYAARQAWNEDQQGEAPEPGDPNVVDREDLTGRTWLTTNFWMGSTGSTVKVKIDGDPEREATRTQELRGEDQLVGPEWSDPHAAAQQLLSDASLADRSMHLWRFELPADLAAGEHSAEVTATDSYGRRFTDELRFQVVEQR
ncbi:calcineurin-like phosphoesterase C-terminal domain-containing protein [Nonomuraea sp. K274]|uniref:Calcineurin-like phosphoesterase C-terminal domain-containing protein n=1 Tax=Nonomuraea cypriaca TaxID=1187855 RepID=A0A931A4H1_9ACTN|nr:calcineurin-like phosphoesterase family protein [Nonomuraea cypriaca]MBF8184629.1 calcineurin-like phosphoesterase C-terminal domain-containing protein [Nonomuraea cypriaca]